jgi:acetyl/propionyl-CoA carboxylase alpha subunit
MSESARPIRTLLIANRGEIAARIARTCRQLGVRSVAVFAAGDRQALHVRSADLAVPLERGGSPAGYLDAEALIAAAQRCGADAVHPGYGFLAENAGFAQACRDAGLTFVGPPAEAIAAMGDKRAAKRWARAAGVPVLPGVEEDAEDASGAAPDRALIEAAADVPCPLLVKAAAGGGGKGMRRVDRPEALPEAIARVRQEAQAAFGSDRLLIERCVDRPRHVEVQVLADGHGTVLHLHDRDCSVQRRHQKLLEEAPAPDLPEATRARMHRAAVDLAAAIGYRGAGTVEFVLDTGSGEAFFLEMNTRLQVEHPVTEAILGLDLVAWQLRIAAGEPLAFAQGDLVPQGCAVEARLNAEDPARDFAPAAGRIDLFEPAPGTEVRVDAAVAEGDAVSPDYDSLIAKLIAHGPDRPTALAKLARALETTRVFGVPTTAPLLADLLRDPAMAAGPVTTGYLQARWPDGWPGPDRSDPGRAAAVVQAAACAAVRAAAQPAGGSPWHRLGPWRVAESGIGPGRSYLVLRDLDGALHRVWAGPTADGGDRIRLQSAGGNDGPPEATVLACSWTGAPGAPGWLVLEGDGAPVRSWRVLDRGGRIHLDDGRGWTAFDWLSPEAADLGGAEGPDAGSLTAPMPGRVSSVEVAVGDAVRRGDAIVVLESMKLFHPVTAPADGVVRALPLAPGDAVVAGQRLAEIEPAASEAAVQ